MHDGPPPFLFDLDGTLADTLADISASANHVRAGFGLPPLPPDRVRRAVGDGARELLRRTLQDGAGPDSPPLDDAALDAAMRRYREHHDRQCTVAVALYPGVREHLERLREGGHPLAVVTNKPVRFAERIVAHLGLDRLLPVVVGGDSLPQQKPDPAPVAHALERLGAPPRRGTMVGDGVQDLRAGKAAGLATIACLYGYREAEVLRDEGADAYWRAFGVPAPAP